MNTKSYLSQIKRLNRMIDNKLTERFQLKTTACKITISNEGERVQTSSDKDRLGSSVAKIVDLENEIDELIASYIDKKNHIIKQIDEIEDTDHYTVLSMYYVGEYTIEDIAKKMSYTTRNVFKIRNRALEEFEKKYGHEYLNI